MTKGVVGNMYPEKEIPDYSDEMLVAFCGINCRGCKERSKQRMNLGKSFKASLQELPLDLFKEVLPQFKSIDQVMTFIDFLPQLTVMQTCCTYTAEPCGDPNCEIRICVKNKGYRTCAECTDYKICSKLDFLKPHHETLISDLNLIKEHGFEQYVDEVIAKFRLDPVVIE